MENGEARRVLREWLRRRLVNGGVPAVELRQEVLTFCDTTPGLARGLLVSVLDSVLVPLIREVVSDTVPIRKRELTFKVSSRGER